MVTSVDELITESRSEALANGAWLASDEHRLLLEDSLGPLFGLTGWTLIWLNAGENSYANTSARVIAIERVPSGAMPASDEEIAELVALSFLHEVGHGLYSTNSGTFQTMRLLVPQQLGRSVDHLYQRIEDARVMRLADQDNNPLAPKLLEVIDRGFEESETQYLSRTGDAEPWTTAPASQRNQLFLALERRTSHPGEILTLHPDVETELPLCEATIEPAWTGSTETAGLVAIGVAQQIFDSQLLN